MSAQKRQRAQTGEVLTWGCPVHKRLVRGRLPHGAKLPKQTMANAIEVAVTCTCGEEHRVQAITRPPRDGESSFDVDPVELRSLPRPRGH